MINTKPAYVRPTSRAEPIPSPREIHPNVAFLASLMDDFFQVPGTPYRIGLDGILGLIPVVGDFFTLIMGILFLKEAERLGVPSRIKARMYGNYIVDALVGMIPLLGDAFDFAFKAHRRNLRLLEDHLRGQSEFIGSEKCYAVSWPSALGSALVASVAITSYMLVIPRWLGIEEMDIGLTIAGLTAPEGDAWFTLSRLAWHMGNGVVYVLSYAVVLRYWQKQSTWATGMVLAVFLWLAGPMLLIPTLLNWWGLPADLTHPGIFMLDLDLGWWPAAIDLGAHLVHGIVAGVIYKHRRIQPDHGRGHPQAWNIAGCPNGAHSI